MKIIIKKPELFSRKYLLENGKQNNADVWLDVDGYVTEDEDSGETVPFCGVVYCLDENGEYNEGIDSYYVCDETGFPIISVAYFSDGSLETYEKRLINHRMNVCNEYEFIAYKYNNSFEEIERYEKKFEDGIIRRFYFDCNKIRRISINYNNFKNSFDYEFTDHNTLLRQDFSYNNDTHRNIFWNADGTVTYDHIKYKYYRESFSFDKSKYELTVFIDANYNSVETVNEIQNGKVVHAVREYESYPGCIMSEMHYCDKEKKYNGLLKDIDGTLLLETEYNEITGDRRFKEYDKDGSVISDFVLKKISNKTEMLNDYEFIFE
jgi:hypothetical protein